MIKQIIAGMGATAGAGGLLAVFTYKPQVVPVATLKPAASATVAAGPAASGHPLPGSSSAPQSAPSPTPTAKATATPKTTATPTPGGHTPTPSPTPTATPTGLYKDGTWTGSLVSTVYGQVKVAVVVSGGKIAGLNFITMPAGDGQTNMHTNDCETQLPGEFVAAQSANVNAITGATQTSDGVVQSATPALAAAHN